MILLQKQKKFKTHNTMKIAFTAQGSTWDSLIDPRFGRAHYLLVYDDQTGQLTAYDNSANANAMHGAGPNTASALADLGANVLITGNGPGGNAARVLQRMGIAVYVGAKGTVRQALDDFKSGKLRLQSMF